MGGFQKGDRVRVNGNAPVPFVRDKSVEGMVGTVVKHDGMYTRINIEELGDDGNNLPMRLDEIDLVEPEPVVEFYTVEELQTQVDAIKQIIELYPKGIRLIKE